jgi:hypothetical protein
MPRVPEQHREGIQQDAKATDLLEGRIAADTPVEQAHEVVDPGEVELLPDEVRLEVLLRALLRVEADQIGERGFSPPVEIECPDEILLGLGYPFVDFLKIVRRGCVLSPPPRA